MSTENFWLSLIFHTECRYILQLLRMLYLNNMVFKGIFSGTIAKAIVESVDSGDDSAYAVGALHGGLEMVQHASDPFVVGLMMVTSHHFRPDVTSASHAHAVSHQSSLSQCNKCNHCNSAD